jgi:hypothetical protein
MTLNRMDCPDCAFSGTAPVRKLAGKQKHCADHAKQRRRHSQLLHARRQAEAKDPRGRNTTEPFTPEPLLAQHSARLAVDPWWMEEVTSLLNRTREDAKAAREALAHGTPGAVRGALRNVLVSQRALDEALSGAARYMSEA